MGWIGEIEGWLWQKALSKALKRGAAVAIAWAAAFAAKQNLQNFGVHVDQAQLTIGLTGVLEFVRNWLKFKYGLDWL